MNYSSIFPPPNMRFCFGPINETDPETIDYFIHQKEELSNIYKFYHGWMQLPFAIVGITLSTIYSLSCYRAIRDHRVSRKSYVLLLNRSVGDMLSCCVTFGVFFYVIVTPEPSRDVVQITDSIIIGCFWAGMTSYVCLSLLKLYAVARPLEYRHSITMMKCIYLIIVSWIVFFAMCAYALTMMAFVKIQSLMDWSGCKMHTCMRNYYRFRNFSMVLVYWSTLIVFFVTVLLIKRHQRFARLHSKKGTNPEPFKKDSTKKKLQDRFPLWKLSMNVGTFAVFNSIYTIWATTLLLIADRCFWVLHNNRMIGLLSFVHLSIMLRIIVDPILAFITDVPIRRQMLTLIGLQKYIKTYSRNQMEENSSEPPPKTSSTTLSSRPSSTVRTKLDEKF